MGKRVVLALNVKANNQIINIHHIKPNQTPL